MPELLLTAKKFGSRLRHHILAWRKPSSRNFSKNIASVSAMATAKSRPKMTFGEAAAIHLRHLEDNLSIKPRTRDYWQECLAALKKSWAGLNETEVRKITQADYKKWATAYAKKVTPTRYNNTVSVLRHILNVAVEAGAVYSNATAVVKRAAVRGKEIALPAIDKFNALIAEMRVGRSRDSLTCADFVLGLAVTGMHKGEANALEWRDVDFEAGEIAVRGIATNELL
jgi:integrase